MESKATNIGAELASIRSSACVLWLLFQGCYGIPEYVNDWVSDSCAFSWAFFFLFVCLVKFQWNMFFSSYHILFCYFFIIILKSCSFLIRDKKKVDERRGEKEVGEAKTIIKIHCLRKESVFNKKWKKGVCHKNLKWMTGKNINQIYKNTEFVISLKYLLLLLSERKM